MVNQKNNLVLVLKLGLVLGGVSLLLVACNLVASENVASHAQVNIESESESKMAGLGADKHLLDQLLTRREFNLPKMFDFQRFKATFRKIYSSSLEEMARLKLFLARSYRAFISAVSYKHRGSSYYLAVNERSDWTRAELEQNENKYLTNDEGDQGQADKMSSLLAKDDNGREHGQLEPEQRDELMGPEELAAEFAEIERRSGEPRYAQLAEELRKAGQEQQQQQQQQLEINKLRRRRSAESLENIVQVAGPEVEVKVYQVHEDEAPIVSNNENYEGREQIITGMYADHVMHPEFKLPKEKWIVDGNWRDYSQLPIKSQYKTVTYLDSFWSLFGLGEMQKQTRDVAPTRGRAPGKPQAELIARAGTDNVVWVDQRRSGCLPEVKNQRACGSCYAFAVAAFFEHAFCKETGKLAKFSEQYLVDCGHKLELHGCDGAPVESAGEFFINFGLELDKHYPYRAYQEMCPYKPETDMTHMGYVRLDVNHVARIPVPIWEDYLERTVLVVTINTAGNFHEYGGGVWDGLKCEDRPRHAVVVIGHGREDEEEYWLIRNSYGPDWGEAGYFKLNKNSNCIHPQYGYVWGSSNGASVRLWPERNKHVPEPIAKDTSYQVKKIINTAGNTVSYFRKFLPTTGNE